MEGCIPFSVLFHVQNQVPCAHCDTKFDHLGIILICFLSRVRFELIVTIFMSVQ